jgi:hypothetical protein
VEDLGLTRPIPRMKQVYNPIRQKLLWMSL